MTCHDLKHLLPPYQSGELPPAQQEFLSLHLSGCATCRAALADLSLTQRQLESLRGDPWQPQLTGRIAAALKRRQKTRTLGHWLGAGLKAGGVAAIAAALVLALLLALPGDLLLRPAAPPVGSRVLVLAGDTLVDVDTAAGRVAGTAPVGGQAALVTGAGKNWLLSGSTLYELGPAPDEVRQVAAGLTGRLLGASPDGRTLWLLRDEGPDAFAIDAVDTATGTVTRDTEPKPGTAGRATVTPDGRSLLVLARVTDLTFLKVIDSNSRTRVEAHPLLTFAPDDTPLAAPDGQTVWVAGPGRLARVQVGSTGAPAYTPVPGLTPAAALSPDGRQLAAVTDAGGLLLADLPSGQTRTIQPAGRYQHVLWDASGDWFYAAAPGQLDVIPARGRTASHTTVVLPSGPVRTINAR
jgi:hypothetical protein